MKPAPKKEGAGPRIGARGDEKQASGRVNGGQRSHCQRAHLPRVFTPSASERAP